METVNDKGSATTGASSPEEDHVASPSDTHSQVVLEAVMAATTMSNISWLEALWRRVLRVDTPTQDKVHLIERSGDGHRRHDVARATIRRSDAGQWEIDSPRLQEEPWVRPAPQDDLEDAILDAALVVYEGERDLWERRARRMYPWLSGARRRDINRVTWAGEQEGR